MFAKILYLSDGVKYSEPFLDCLCYFSFFGYKHFLFVVLVVTFTVLAILRYSVILGHPLS